MGILKYDRDLGRVLIFKAEFFYPIALVSLGPYSEISVLNGFLCLIFIRFLYVSITPFMVSAEIIDRLWLAKLDTLKTVA